MMKRMLSVIYIMKEKLNSHPFSLPVRVCVCVCLCVHMCSYCYFVELDDYIYI